MTGHRFGSGGVALLLLLAAGMPLAAEQPPESVDLPVAVTQGKDVPDYYVVGKFFETADLYYMRKSRGTWKSFLDKLEVPEGSEAEKLLVLATYEARSITTETLELTPWKDDPVAFRKVQRDHTRSQVRRLGKLWRQFQLDWKRTGQRPEPLLEYLETRSRHQVKVYTLGTRTPEEQRERDEIMSEFSDPDESN